MAYQSREGFVIRIMSACVGMMICPHWCARQKKSGSGPRSIEVTSMTAGNGNEKETRMGMGEQGLVGEQVSALIAWPSSLQTDQSHQG